MRGSVKPILKLIGSVAVVIIVVTIGLGFWFVTRSHPQTSGTQHVTGLESRVEVIRDSFGVPQIYADNTDDLFFVQGYVHAQDRLWQMELNRHIGLGQLSEIFGDVVFGSSTTVEVDKFLRTIGLARAARADWAGLDNRARHDLQQYADGVNAFLHSHQDTLPLEFSLLSINDGKNYHMADWQPIDTIVWGKVMAYNLSGNYKRELLRAALSDALGESAASALLSAFPTDGPFIIPPDVKNYAAIPQPLSAPQTRARLRTSIGQPDLGTLAAIDNSLGALGEGLGSNNWVVDGTRTTTGKPLLANDPHLGIQMPSIWYTNGIHCAPVSSACPYDVVGYTFPGVPGVVVGHNQRIAWGVTNTGPDVQDLFVEKINPANPNQYEYQGQWANMTLDSEVIHVKGSADVPLTIQTTRHGPIMTPVLKGVTVTLALEWTATRERGTVVQSLLQLDRAQDWNEFRDALRLWDVPAQNFVYADVEGHIGYQMPGRVPIRAQGDGGAPVPGWTGEYEWTGYIPFDELPYVYDPPTHFIATANNQVVPGDFKYLLTRDWNAPFRAMRINELIRSKDKLSADDFKTMQGDTYSVPLTKLQQIMVLLEPQGWLQARAFKYVKDWDGNLTADTIGGAIVEVTYQRIVRDLWSERLGADLFKSYLDAGGAHRQFVYQLLDDPNSPWWDDARTPARETRDDRVASAYAESVDWLGNQFGDWPPDWHWGRMHTATFEHPFGSKLPLDLIFNFGPLHAPGDGFTIFNTGFDDTDPYKEQVVSSMREILDLSNLDHSLWIHTTGQSGQPFTAHYADLAPLWSGVRYAPLYSAREAVERSKAADLILIP